MPQSIATIRVHLVFSTKNREDLITPRIEPDLYAYMAQIFKTMQSPAICLGGTANHLHALFSLSKNFALAKVIEEVKADSSKWIKSQGAEFRRFYWQTGYAAFSIGKSGEEALIRYIQNQKRHHQRRDFKAELLDLLGKYEVLYREEHLWD